MAKLIVKREDVPARIAAYDPAIHGQGEEGVDAWKRYALAYLNEDPQRRLPVGSEGDALDVIREAVRLKGGYAPKGPGWAS